MKVVLTNDFQIVTSVVKDAFRVAPWRIEDMPQSEITKRLNMFAPGRRYLLAAVCDENCESWTIPAETEVAGIAWFGFPKAGEIPDEVIKYLNAIAPDMPPVYFGATAVRREWQGKGVGLKLKEDALKLISSLYYSCVIVTRMHSDNQPIIHINKSHGFLPSGIIETSADGVRQEWWFKIDS